TTRLSVLGIIKSLSGSVKSIDYQLDNYCRWGVWASPSDYGKDKVYKNFMERLKNGEFQKSAYNYQLYSWDVIRGNLDTNIIPFMLKNKNVKFFLYFPPYSILGQKAFYLQDVLKTELEYKKYLIERVGKLSNVKIYDFQNAKDIIYNLDNYKDKSHHKMEVNDYIINCMAENKYNVKDMDINKEYEQFTKDVAAYDIYKNQ
ncbi:MAG TPA: hypothetical protein VHT34_01420, partial [Clostridia bacterium]|nr:hypothetical protein [Clostridia bacterium]